ncbi:hypothetical protein MIR68_008417 [Amoeboaphelidium protococcarum]|nr:hypothetical protein MIR68_008417 [Amoeboaphelidium protococcarum]
MSAQTQSVRSGINNNVISLTDFGAVIPGVTFTVVVVLVIVILLISIATSIVLGIYCGKLKRRRQNGNSNIHNKQRKQGDVPLGVINDTSMLNSGDTSLSLYRNRGETTALRMQNTTMYTEGKTLALPGFLMLISELDFSLGKAFAEGGAGTVYLGELKNESAIKRMGGETSCVVKVMKPIEDASVDDAMALFNHEISIVWLLNECPNVIRLIGYCPQPSMILLKYYPLGSLEDLIHKNGTGGESNKQPLVPDNQWTPKFILRMMRDVANGLADMHDNGLVHNDVKPGNVLLDKQSGNGELYCVLCDFGVTSIVDGSLLRVKAYQKSRIKGASLVYAAPEVLLAFQNNLDIDEIAEPERIKAGDVYAFSMVVYELTQRRIPWWDVDDLEEISRSVMTGVRPKLGKSLYERAQTDPYLNLIISIMERCQHQDPFQRMSFSSVVDEIGERLGTSKRQKTRTDMNVRQMLFDNAKSTQIKKMETQAKIMSGGQASQSFAPAPNASNKNMLMQSQQLMPQYQQAAFGKNDFNNIPQQSSSNGNRYSQAQQQSTSMASQSNVNLQRAVSQRQAPQNQVNLQRAASQRQQPAISMYQANPIVQQQQQQQSQQQLMQYPAGVLPSISDIPITGPPPPAVNNRNININVNNSMDQLQPSQEQQQMPKQQQPPYNKPLLVDDNATQLGDMLDKILINLKDQ